MQPHFFSIPVRLRGESHKRDSFLYAGFKIKKGNGDCVQNNEMEGKKMTIRESLELREKEYLSPYAAFSMDSRGRRRMEEPCDIRPVFQRDRGFYIVNRSGV